MRSGSTSSRVAVVGAGVAGLCCARTLRCAGVPVVVHEASDGVGGRVRTDVVDGFRLDRGFQVLLTAYPEAQAQLDYAALDLRRFEPGAIVRVAGRFERVSDPLRRPARLFQTLFARVGSLADKLRIATLRRAVRRGLPEGTAEDALRAHGFSDRIIERLFRPWFGGVFLDRSLSASSNAFAYSFRMFGAGDSALPAMGMGAIPEQLAADLDVRLEAPVASLDALDADAVVVATEAPAAHGLLGRDPPPPGRGVRTLFFDAPEPPVREPVLVLNGDGEGPINDLCVLSEVARTYAPAGRALVSVSVLDHVEAPDLEGAVRAQLADWFGAAARDWRHLRTYTIPHALPSQRPGELPHERDVKTPGGVYVCGDHREAASLQGAMASGRRAAEAVLADLGVDRGP